MLRNILQWPHWGVVRYVTGLVTALATVATVGFAIWTYFEAIDDEALIEMRDRVVFNIVRDSDTAGITLEDIAAQYIARMPAPTSDAVEDDIISTLLRLTPDDVALVDDRWFHSGSAPESRLKAFILTSLLEYH